MQLREYAGDIVRAVNNSASARQDQTDQVVSAIGSSIKAYNERSEALEVAVRDSAVQTSEVIAPAAIAEMQSARRNAAAIIGAVDTGTTKLVEAIDALGRALVPTIGEGRYV